MAKLVEYDVIREHRGDKITDDGVVSHDYVAGDKRLADPSVVKHLVGAVLVAPDEKASPVHKNKAEGGAPANKASEKKAD